MILATHGILANSVPLSTLNNSLYAVYNAENNANDGLGFYNGTAIGGITYTAGKIGNAFTFNGTNAYADFGDFFDLGTSSWSYACWINTNSTATSQGIFSKTYSGFGLGRFFATLNNGTDIRFFVSLADPGNNLDIRLNATNVVGEWSHLVFVIDRSDNVKIYRNGVVTTPTIVSGTNNLTPYISSNYNTSNPFRIGATTASNNTTAVNFFSGQIDAVGIWNRVLTPTEITELYNSGNGKQYPY